MNLTFTFSWFFLSLPFLYSKSGITYMHLFNIKEEGKTSILPVYLFKTKLSSTNIPNTEICFSTF